MRFVVSNGERFRERLRNIPLNPEEFLSSSLVVVCLNDADEIVGAAGIRSFFNIAVSYVREDYRGHGIGSKQLQIAIEAATRRPPYFATGTVYAENVVALHVDRKLGFREVLFLKKTRQFLLVTTTTRMGKLAYALFRLAGYLFPNTLWSHLHWSLYNRSLRASNLRKKEF